MTWQPQEQQPCPRCKGSTIWTYEKHDSSMIFVRSCVDQEGCGYRTSYTLNVTEISL